jgi:hypothetical protein
LFIPTVVHNASKKLTALHHICTSIGVGFEMNELAIAKLLRPIGHRFGQNMAVHVYF